MSKLLKLTMTDGREVLTQVIAAYDAGPHRVINEDEGCECYAVLETLDEIAELNNGASQEITIRDQLAMSAMNALLSGLYSSSSESGWMHDEISDYAYRQADSMIKARESK